ncbi:hypothetical protein GPECTOR_8g333 [Gonium pectorale]|uniref:Sfi1 spindle body domain-containing protein n=1 Tax=Gonium pectorale TaxID=33097 RepID=A0A150GUE8_GONPE|nr:hypothetical protein GPECTOR_8g333 [Gonium pectorale]|eukprot:KXZ52960.1 hypothetical protein GPECTOR_8g333 [Gonium pectorale]
MRRRSRQAAARRAMLKRWASLVLGAWWDMVLERRQLALSFQLIMRNEVHRLLRQSFKRLSREHDRLQRADAGRDIVLRGLVVRTLRHWRALTEVRRSRAEWRAQRLYEAAVERKHRLLLAWLDVASLMAEHRRIVHASLVKVHRRLAGNILRAWRERVLSSVVKRMKVLAAALSWERGSLVKVHRRLAGNILRAWRERVLSSVVKRMKVLAAALSWERGMKARAWRGWRNRVHSSKAIADDFALAARHYQTRRMSLCFNVLLAIWHGYQERLTRALFFRSHKNDLAKAEVLAAWRELVGWLQWKNDKIRRALAHRRSQLLAGSLYGWYYITRHIVASKRSVAAAVLHWGRKQRAAVFAAWRAWAAHHRELMERAEGYCLLRETRTKELVLLAFKANVIRKARIAGALAHHRRYVARLVLSGWLLRMLLAGEWAQRMEAVGVKIQRQRLFDAFASLRGAVEYRRYKLGMLHAALRFWRLARQRSALDGLRWHAMRRRLKRAVALRGQLSTAAWALRVWRERTYYRKRLRFRYELAVAGNRRAALKRGLEQWRSYLKYRAARKAQLNRAARHWLHGTAGRAFRSWHEYHRHLHDAKEHARNIVRRWRKRDAADALRAFAENVARRRRKRGADNFFRRAHARRTIRAWREYLKLRDAGEFWRLNSLAGAFGAWREHALWKRHLYGIGRRVAGRWQHLMAAMAFSAWRAYATRRRHYRTLGMLLASRTRRGLLHTIISSWSTFATLSVRNKLLAAELSRRARLHALRAMLYGWHDVVVRRKYLRAVGYTIAARHLGLVKEAAFKAWHEYGEYLKRLREASEEVRIRLGREALGGLFDAWRDYAGYKAHLRAVSVEVTARLQHNTLSGIFGAWHEHATYVAHLRAVSEYVSDRLQRGTLFGVFDAWHAWAAYSTHLRIVSEQVISRLQLGTLSGILEAWRSFATKSARLRSLSSAITSRLRDKTVSGVFGWWRTWAADSARLRRKCTTLSSRLQRRTLWGILSGWRTFAKSAVRLRAISQHLATRLQQRTLSGVFTAWRQYAAYSARLHSIERGIAARVQRRSLGGWLLAWREYAAYSARLRTASRLVSGRLRRGTLGGIFGAWRSHAGHMAALKSLLERVLLRTAALAFFGWKEYTMEKARRRAQAAAIQERLRAEPALSETAAYAATRIRNFPLAVAFYTWFDQAKEARYLRDKTTKAVLLYAVLHAWRRATRQLARLKGILARIMAREMAMAWLGWRELVLATRARSQGWRGVIAEARRGAYLAEELHRRFAAQGWRERAQERRQARERLWQAARVLLFGSLARAFSAWLQHTQAMVIKRAVFVRKQRALAEALRRGDELAARRGAELLELAFRSWRLRAGIFREVSRRLRAVQGRTLAIAFEDWREYAGTKRARAMKQVAVLRLRLLARPLRAWRVASARSAEEAATKLALAAAHHRETLLDTALMSWRRHHELFAVRCEALRRALAAAGEAVDAGLLVRAWDAWIGSMSRRLTVLALAEQASRRRKRRMLSGAFEVWLQYTQAMRDGGIDPGSPYMSPRERGTERRLVTRMAALAGNEQAIAAMDASNPALLDGLYPSAALQAAQARRQEVSAFLSLTRRAASAGRARPTPSDVARGRDQSARDWPPRGDWLRERDREQGHGRRRSLGGTSAGSKASGSSQDGSASTAISSGAGGADLVDRAMQIVRATPGLLSPGKGRGLASGLTPAHIHFATNALRKSTTAVAAEDVPDGSPYNDRLDLRALYNNAAAAQPISAAFGGFLTGQQPVPSPAPLSRPATPLTASVPIAPRRIDFTAARGSSGPSQPPSSVRSSAGGSGSGAAYYGYGTPSQSSHPYAAQQSMPVELGSEAESVAGSDALGPAALGSRTGPFLDSSAPSRQSSLTLARSRSGSMGGFNDIGLGRFA